MWHNLTSTYSPGKDQLDDDLRQAMDAAIDQGPFASAANAHDVSKFLCTTLAGLGLPHQLDFFSSDPQDVAAVMNCIHALIKQRVIDKETREHLEASTRKLRSETQVAQRERERLEEQLKEQYGVQGSLEIRLRQSERAAKVANADSSTRIDRDGRQLKQLTAKLTQAQVRLNAKDQEIEQLKQRLNTALAAKGPSGSGALDGAATAGGTEGVAGVGTGITSRLSAGGSSGQLQQRLSAGGRNSHTVHQLQQCQQELTQAKRQIEASASHVRALEDDNVRLRAQLGQAQQNLTNLKARCESLGVVVADSEVRLISSTDAYPQSDNNAGGVGSSTGTGAARGGAAAGRGGGGGGGMGGASTSAQAIKESALTDADLRKWVVSDLQVVRDRCQSLLASQSQADNTLGRSPSGVDLDTALITLKDQDKALTRALTLLRRADAQRDAAQQRAHAAQHKSVLLEKKITEVTTENNTLAEQIRDLELRCDHLVDQLDQVTRHTRTSSAGTAITASGMVITAADGMADGAGPYGDRGGGRGGNMTSVVWEWPSSPSASLCDGVGSSGRAGAEQGGVGWAGDREGAGKLSHSGHALDKSLSKRTAEMVAAIQTSKLGMGPQSMGDGSGTALMQPQQPQQHLDGHMSSSGRFVPGLPIASITNSTVPSSYGVPLGSDTGAVDSPTTTCNATAADGFMGRWASGPIGAPPRASPRVVPPKLELPPGPGSARRSASGTISGAWAAAVDPSKRESLDGAPNSARSNSGTAGGWPRRASCTGTGAGGGGGVGVAPRLRWPSSTGMTGDVARPSPRELLELLDNPDLPAWAVQRRLTGTGGEELQGE